MMACIFVRGGSRHGKTGRSVTNGATATDGAPTADDAPAAGGVPTAELLSQLARRIAASLDLRETLQVVADAVVDRLGFGGVAVNLLRPGDVCEVAAVAGPAELREALLGAQAPMEAVRDMLAACEPWGELRFLDHRKGEGIGRDIPEWIPPILPSDDPDAWHPDDSLFAPLCAPDGTLIGVLSVDMPDGGRLPDPQQRQLLEQFAAHAALAIEHSRVHTQMADSEQLFRAMFDRSPIAIALLTEEDNRITQVNAACEWLLGRDAAELVGSPAVELARPDPAPRRRSTDNGTGPADQYEVHFTRPDGEEIWGRVNSTLLAPATDIGQRLLLTQIEDITQLRTMQARFAHAATHDQLTGLANRALVLDQLAELLVRSQPPSARTAVLFCDVDHFKQINDTLGHAAGDQLLIEIGRSLTLTARAQDIVGRIGGDEFVLVAHPVPTRSEAASLAQRVLRTVRHPVDLNGEPVLPSLSIGVALSGPGDSADSVLAAADRALYTAKAAGRSRWQLAPGR
jgi:diguanylate cyclase (GGDEF)-like protein/PAS domain S-box-containing protein